MKDKKELIDISKNIYKAFRENLKSETVFSTILKFLITAKKSCNDEEKLDKFLNTIMLCRQKNIDIIGGNNRAKNDFIYFIDNILEIKRFNNKYKIMNKELENLSFDEIHYIFGWCHRLLKSKY
ncbi:hypothetical protein ACAG39_11590 [Caldicellulosiruptoraceae bacterium PP1]